MLQCSREGTSQDPTPPPRGHPGSVRWSLVSEVDEDNRPDSHVEFIRSVRSFQCELLNQFHTTSPPGSQELSNPGDFGKCSPNQSEEVEEPYLARFAQPFPARPLWAALPRPSPLGVPDVVPGGESWPSDFSCAPQVCVVLKGSMSMRAAVHGALSKLAKHPVGLLVCVNPKVPESDSSGRLLLFAVVGLRAPKRGESSVAGNKLRQNMLYGSPSRRHGRSMTEVNLHECYEEDDIISVAEQRQMVWAAVHEALWEAEGCLPEVIVEIFMLQDVWLYDRLFRWLASKTKLTWRDSVRTLQREELDLIVHQFGEETATHFLFVEQYVRHLRAAAVFAVCCLALSHLASSGLFGDAPSSSKLPWTLLAAFLPAWGFHFLASWRAVASKAGFRWLGSLGSVQNSVKEVARLQSVESDADKRWRYLLVTLLNVPLMGMQLLLVLGVTVGFVVIEVCIYDVAWDTMSLLLQLLASAVYNLAFGVAFMLILGLFHPVSNMVTKCEGHPDPDLAKWHLTAKIYANWFFAVFLYFFVIAFLYVPFGRDLASLFVPGHGGNSTDHIAGNSTNEHRSPQHIIRSALAEFRPDAGRLTGDVLLFFVMQDMMRMSQVLLPVLRALWNPPLRTEQSSGESSPLRHRRTAPVSGLLGMMKLCLKSREREEDRDRAEDMSVPWKPHHNGDTSEDEENENALHSARSNEQLMETRKSGRNSRRLSASPARRRFSSAEARLSFSLDTRDVSALQGLPGRVPATPATRPMLRQTSQSLSGRGCLVAFLHAGKLRVEREQAAQQQEEVAMLACSLELPKPCGRVEPAATSRLRTCYASGQRAALEEDDEECLGDLFTLSCDGAVLQSAKGSVVRLGLLVELLEQQPSGGGSNSWGCDLELCIGQESLEETPGVGTLAVKSGTAELGPVRIEYVAGLVRAPTHPEALERVPRALRRAKIGLAPETALMQPSSEVLAFEEARALSITPGAPQPRVQEGLPWNWWDEELSALYWDEVFELFAVKETFETFEIYAHLATSFSYVCLFGISCPICPLLALLFTCVEVRQDQLRLLWLSRPPHPDEETLRFKWRVSLGAWYEILRFTCHLSVVVNLLLWGVTYEGLNGTKPTDWSSKDWWRGLALFLLLERVAVQLSKLLHQYFSQLDHETASAYLRRYQRLRRALTTQEEDNLKTGPGGSAVTPRTSRQAMQELVRRRMTRIPSKGISSLL